MGLFDFLKVEKKYCDICGEEIKLLGNKKLANGNCCKKCASKLSPWFHERKNSTVEEIIQQIDDRENNEVAVQNFVITKVIGTNSNYKVYFDEVKHQLMVSNSNRVKESNPDVLDYHQITACLVDFRENKSELHYKDNTNKLVSYEPKQYEYRYSCYLTFYVDHPYFSEMTFQIGNTVYIENPFVKDFVKAKGAKHDLMPFVPNLTHSREYQELVMIVEEIKETLHLD